MNRIKITLVKSGVSVIAELRDEKCPVTLNSLYSVLPYNGKAFHAKWGGGEIWTQIHDFPKYAHENETCLPSIGEILIMDQGNNTVAFDLWYDRGWAFGGTGFMNGAAVGMVISGLAEFAPEAAKLSYEGAQEICIEKVD